MLVLTIIPPPKSESRWVFFLYSTFWNDKHTRFQSHTNTRTRWCGWDAIGTARWFSTPEHSTRWFSMMYGNHSIFSNSSSVFAFFLSAHVLWHFGRSLALLISINILFKNKRKTVYNTFHNHTWFLHKMFQNKLSLLKAILSSDSDPLVAAAGSRLGSLCLCVEATVRDRQLSRFCCSEENLPVSEWVGD